MQSSCFITTVTSRARRTMPPNSCALLTRRGCGNGTRHMPAAERDKDTQTCRGGAQALHARPPLAALTPPHSPPSARRHRHERRTDSPVHRPTSTRYNHLLVCAHSPHCAIQHHRAHALIEVLTLSLFSIRSCRLWAITRTRSRCTLACCRSTRACRSRCRRHPHNRRDTSRGPWTPSWSGRACRDGRSRRTTPRCTTRRSRKGWEPSGNCCRRCRRDRSSTKPRGWERSTWRSTRTTSTGRAGSPSPPRPVVRLEAVPSRVSRCHTSRAQRRASATWTLCRTLQCRITSRISWIISSSRN